MRRSLEDLRSRPKEERKTIAASIAIIFVVILFLGWVVYLFRSIAATPAPDLQSAAGSIDTSGFQQAGEELEQAYGSTTQFIDSASGTVELQEVSSTSEPSL